MKHDSIDLKEQLKEKGYKVTSQRQVVLDVILENEGDHLSTEEIYNLVKKTCPEIGIATIYRTLQLLDSMGIIHKIDLDDGFMRYELNRHKDDHRHHHLICTSCNKVFEVKEDLLEPLEEQIFDKYGFNVKDHRVKFYGTCKDCGKNKGQA